MIETTFDLNFESSVKKIRKTDKNDIRSRGKNSYTGFRHPRTA